MYLDIPWAQPFNICSKTLAEMINTRENEIDFCRIVRGTPLTCSAVKLVNIVLKTTILNLWNGPEE